MASVLTILGNSSLCAYLYEPEPITYAWSVNSILYLVHKAEVGVLETICIKTVTWDGYRILYKDTFNALWEEEDLCEEDDARGKVATYLEEQEELLSQRLLRCN